MEFFDLYNEKFASKGTRPIRTENGNIYKYDFTLKKTVLVNEDDIKCKDSIVSVFIRDENILKTMKDTIDYVKIVKDDICKNILKLDKWHFDFVLPVRLINYLTKQSIKGEIKVSSPILLRAIDSASAGGCLIAKKGIHEGKYYLYDIANSYNKFFLDFDIPSNPKLTTVQTIRKEVLTLYRLKITSENFEKSKQMQFRTNRCQWFSNFDVQIFDMFGIEYSLIDGKNNCVEFEDRIECDFEWMQKINEVKQNLDGEKDALKKKVFKNLLSSFWGNICKYHCITEEEYGKEIPDNYFHKVGQDKQDLFIHPEKYYLYSVAICKPFVLAYARLRLLKQINKIEHKGYNVIYAHTDSIITNCPSKYFDIGNDIGQWKLEKKTKQGVEIKNIASKKFL